MNRVGFSGSGGQSRGKVRKERADARQPPPVRDADIQYRYMETRFTWTLAKAKRNQRIHGISFDTAKEVFLVLLLVVFVDRSDRDVEAIHLISARRAVDYEKSVYEDQFR